MKRLLNLLFGAAVLVALSGSSLVWAKAHVPLDMVQVCDGRTSTVRNIKVNRLERHLTRRGSCRLTACDFAQVTLPKALCVPVDVVINNGGAGGPDGFCDSVVIPLLDPADGTGAAGRERARCFDPF